mgnify:CR=1 FL=1
MPVLGSRAFSVQRNWGARCYKRSGCVSVDDIRGRERAQVCLLASLWTNQSTCVGESKGGKEDIQD